MLNGSGQEGRESGGEGATRIGEHVLALIGDFTEETVIAQETQVATDASGKSLGGVTAGIAEDWIDVDSNNVKYFTFNVPIIAAPAKQCGRVVFSDIHVFPAGGEQWPSGCGGMKDLAPQQKALEFLFFDLSACVQSDGDMPTPVH